MRGACAAAYSAGVSLTRKLACALLLATSFCSSLSASAQKKRLACQS